MGRVERRAHAKREGRNVKEVQENIREHNELKPRSFAIGTTTILFCILKQENLHRIFSICACFSMFSPEN